MKPCSYHSVHAGQFRTMISHTENWPHLKQKCEHLYKKIRSEKKTELSTKACSVNITLGVCSHL